ncbi:MAG: DVUA0089 family protein, partial [Opitutaceae bacterium]|nr:DVUA0089 family protein [Opitutaceae bacterium]
TPRVVNVSVLKTIAVGTSLTAGFVVGGAASKTVLIRAIGPALGLAPFNVAGFMPDPQLTLFDNSRAAVAANNDWGGDAQVALAAARVGAFAVANAASRDAMLFRTLAPGSYTANVSPFGAGGLVIVEIYEVP